jgi:DNA-binding transcriptional LysR family regulator
MRGTEFAEVSAFVAVAENAGFTKAAKRLGVSLASLSQTVRALEERLGVRLLNRTTRSVALTDAGERMLKELRPLLDGFDAVLESVNSFRDKPVGRLRLTVPPPVAKFVLAPVLARFQAQYPGIMMEIIVDSETTDIVASRFDAGFRRANLIARDMIAVRVTDDTRHLVVASPDYLKRRGRLVSPADLQSHNCIRARFPSGDFLPWRFLLDGKTVELQVEGSLIANDPELLISAAVQGIGVVYAIDEYLQPMVKAGSLVSLLDESYLPTVEGFSLFYPSRRQNPGALQAFIDFLRNEWRMRSKARGIASSKVQVRI